MLCRYIALLPGPLLERCLSFLHPLARLLRTCVVNRLWKMRSRVVYVNLFDYFFNGFIGLYKVEYCGSISYH